jgi:hypothetical protein
MATVPPLTIDTESLRDVVRTAEDIRNAVVRQIKLHAIAAEGLREVERARAKHGEQRGIPDGTGPDVRLEQLEPVGAGAPTGIEFANLCKYLTDKRAAAGEVTRADIVLEEIAEAFAEDDLHALRGELIQGIAMLVAWVYDIDLRIKE